MRAVGAAALIALANACSSPSQGNDGGLPDADASASDLGVDSGTDVGGADADVEDWGPEDRHLPDGGSYGVVVRVRMGTAAIGCTLSHHDTWCGDNNNGCCPDNARTATVVDVPEFLIDIFEVSVASYAACVAAGECPVRNGPMDQCNYFHPDRMQYPMNCVTFRDAEAYCSWAGKRLCSEAEWEKAARGGCILQNGECLTTTQPNPWGWELASCHEAVILNPDGALACGFANGSAPIGTRPQGVSPYGAKDMIGNVAEYVADCEHSGHNGRPLDGSAWTTDCRFPGIRGMTKGGSGVNLTSRSAAAYRRESAWPGHESCCGIRCCYD